MPALSRQESTLKGGLEMYYKQRGGWVEVICGCMFSGKTEELIRRVRQAQIARQKVQVFKPRAGELSSYNGKSLDATLAEKPEDVLRVVEDDTNVVAVDDAQLFDWTIAEVCNTLAARGVRVIVAGLDMDFRGEPFGPVPLLMAEAEKVDKLQAICVRCGALASRSQRLIDGEPASYDSPVTMVGASEVYEARCRRCHQVPGKQEGGQ